MREIKFRAWDGETMSEPCNMWLREDHFIEWLNNFPYPDTIFMQFTGLKDKNGKEIYEGDIIRGFRLDYFLPFGEIQEVKVEYENGGFYPFVDNNDYAPYPKSEEVEVIGNIYENPELKEINGSKRHNHQ